MRWPTTWSVLVVIFAAGAAAARGDWPHWRGDSGNGVSLTARPPVAFGPDKQLAWSVEIPGKGSSSPVVVGDMVFVTTAVPVEGADGMLDFRLLCLDRATGRERWSRSAVKAVPHERTHETNGFASASPSTYGIVSMLKENWPAGAKGVSDASAMRAAAQSAKLLVVDQLWLLDSVSRYELLPTAQYEWKAMCTFLK